MKKLETLDDLQAMAKELSDVVRRHANNYHDTVALHIQSANPDALHPTIEIHASNTTTGNTPLIALRLQWFKPLMAEGTLDLRLEVPATA